MNGKEKENIYTIKNDKYQVSVLKKGAELCSFKSLSTDVEYIWKADPQVWGSHAPNLFPIIGCLKEDAFIYQGKEYACPKHGFIRNNENVELLHRTDNSLTFTLKYSKDTLKFYPFQFEYQIRYILKANQLILEHNIINHGNKLMLFSLGGHPGFNCPVGKDEQYADYYLEFENPETVPTWFVLENGLIGRETKPIFDTSNRINLHPQIFNNDALVLKNINSSKVTLKSKKSGSVLAVAFKDFPYLGIWAKPNADYVCIEPWIGVADSVDTTRELNEKEAMVKLDPKKSFKATYSITILQ